MNRKKSILETIYLLLGAFFGVLLTKLYQQPILFYSVEAGVAISVIALLKIAAKYSEEAFEKLRRFVFQGVSGVIAGIAGSIFAIGFTVLTLDLVAGIVFFGLTFVMVALVKDIVPTVEGSTSQKNNDPRLSH